MSVRTVYPMDSKLLVIQARASALPAVPTRRGPKAHKVRRSARTPLERGGFVGGATVDVLTGDEGEGVAVDPGVVPDAVVLTVPADVGTGATVGRDGSEGECVDGTVFRAVVEDGRVADADGRVVATGELVSVGTGALPHPGRNENKSIRQTVAALASKAVRRSDKCFEWRFIRFNQSA